MKKTMALFGSWGWYGENSKPGINVCEYDDGKFKSIKGYYEGVVVGSPVVISDKGILYFINETRDTADLAREGGYAYAARLCGKEIIPINQIKTYSTNPCYCVLDSTQQYLVIVHHASGQDYASKIYRDENGKVRSKVEYDDAAVELVKINEDGSLGEILDFHYHDPAFPGKRSFLHGVFRIPDTDIFMVVDKGLNSVYTYTINYNLGRLVLLDEVELKYNAAPKYLTFVPGKKLAYVCYELDPSVAIVKYDDVSGKLEHLGDFPLQIEDRIMCGQQDFAYSPVKDIMYIIMYEMGENAVKANADVKKLNNSWSNFSHNWGKSDTIIGVYDISDSLNPKLIQYVSTERQGCRRMNLTPDNKYILAFNTSSNEISRLRIEEDGKLTLLDHQDWHAPENVTYFELEE
ncbi:beta-propeller fold lactonase family protein [Traorella massiliensis]|uniref:lactonase family protein n=1 Tax=Traorella massiliensis TaxID=1903263 RepID=UPI00248E9866|nr:beta-propeller fold lactonase family protein [Traorella massiliensis]